MSSNKFKLCFVLMGVLLVLGFDLERGQYAYPMPGYYALSGSFGELRSNHFHSGLDIKTGGQSGAPVVAIEDGYVSRINVSPYGYGKAVYLRHADGKYSVYAHLSRFADTLQSLVYAQQRKTEQYTQEMYLRKHALVFKKGELLGYSGNSGSSLGPHLHFEIRDSAERILNPIPWFKKELPDNRPPIVQEVAFEPLGPTARIAGEHRFYSKWVEGGNGQYRLPGVLEVYGPVGLLYRAYDLLDNAGNHCGINTAHLYLDDSLIYAFDLQRFDFDETRYINLHLAYPFTLHPPKKSYQRAFVEQGNAFSGIRFHRRRGIIELTDGQVHDFCLELIDSHGNRTLLSGKLKRKAPPLVSVPFDYAGTSRLSYQLQRDLLRIDITNPKKIHAQGIYYETLTGTQHKLLPAYRKGNQLVFLLQLDSLHLPRRLFDASGNLQEQLPAWTLALPDRPNIIERGAMRATLPHQSVYQPTYLQVEQRPGSSEMLSDVYVLGDEQIPVFRRYLIGIKPLHSSQAQHAVVAYWFDDEWNYMGSKRGEDGYIYASTNDFGPFCLMADSLAPGIRPINFVDGSRLRRSQNSLRLKLEDDFSGIDDARICATLDGEWIGFDYRYQRDLITHYFVRPPAAGTHRLEIEAWDKAGNRSRKTFTFVVGSGGE